MGVCLELNNRGMKELSGTSVTLCGEIHANLGKIQQNTVSTRLSTAGLCAPGIMRTPNVCITKESYFDDLN